MLKQTSTEPQTVNLQMFSSEIVSHYGITQLPPQAEGEEVEPEDEVNKMHVTQLVLHVHCDILYAYVYVMLACCEVMNGSDVVCESTEINSIFLLLILCIFL